MNLKNISKKYGISENNLKSIYIKYLSLIKEKAILTTEKLLEEDNLSKEDITKNKGDYSFYIRNLGAYYISYKAYKKWKKTKEIK